MQDIDHRFNKLTLATCRPCEPGGPGRRGGATALPLVTLMLLLWGGSLLAAGTPSVAVAKGAQRIGPFPAVRVEGDLRTLPRARGWQPGESIRIIPRRNNHQEKSARHAAQRPPPPNRVDPLLRLHRQARARAGATTLLPPLIYAGQDFNGVYPPDPVGAVGEHYYIQLVNSTSGSTFSIHTKGNGAMVVGPMRLSALGSGTCANGKGDPVVLYDALAKRWLLTEFAATGNTLCVYVSRTADPVTGGWHHYSFVSTISFPDFPKYAVWPDAYYLTTNEAAPGVYALDRTAMLTGAPAEMQFFSVASLPGFGFQALLPSDFDGIIPPPKGAPNTLIRHRDDEAHAPGASNPTEDYLELFEFHINWANAAESTLAGPQVIAVADFDSELCGYQSFSCFPQPNATQRLDPIREVVMWRFPYRNFGDHETLVGSFVVDVDGTDHGGIRWFELRRSGGGWQLHQEGTVAPDASHRWIGSIAMDGSGNIALASSVTDGVSTYPSIRYTGRSATDPAGSMPQGEITIAAGAGSQAAGNRWGDYSALTIDPVDDCGFWYTNEYLLADGRWSTAIAEFRFEGCGAPAFLLSSPNPRTPSLCAATPASPVALDLQVTPIGGFTGPITLSLTGAPQGVSGSATPATSNPPDNATLTLEAAAGVPIGSYPLTLSGTGPGVSERQLPIELTVWDAAPSQPKPLQPGHGAVNQPLSPDFSWEAATQGERYRIEVATDRDFGAVIYSDETRETRYTIHKPLQPGTSYYWRVTALNPCGDGMPSPGLRFKTVNSFCSTPAQAIPDSDGVGISDLLSLTRTGVIEDLDLALRIQHSWVGDLRVTLEHLESGNRALLLDLPGEASTGFGCSGSDIDAVLNDQGGSPVEETCYGSIPTMGGHLRPNEPLGVFGGISLAGSWKLTVSDHYASDVGTLLEWCLYPSIAGVDCSGPDVLLANRSIAAGEVVTCQAGDIELQNVTVEGELVIEKSGTARLSPQVRSIPPGGKITIRTGPAPPP